MLRFFSQTSSPKGASPRRARFSRRYVVALLLDLLALAADQLTVRSTAFANAYAHHIYRLLSLGIGSVMGLVPFSVVELLLYGLVLFLVFDFLRALYRSVREGMHVGAPLLVFVRHVFLLGSALFVLYVFLCGMNYHRTSFSEEAGLSVTIGTERTLGAGTDAEPGMSQRTDTATGANDDGMVDQTEELVALCRYLVSEINQREAAFEASAMSSTESAAAAPLSRTSDVNETDAVASSSSGPAAERTPDSVLTVEGACIGQTKETPKPSMQWLFQAGHAGQRAMEKLGQRYPRLAGHYPFPKPILNSWILSVQQTTGVYSPFTVEANYNRDIPYYDLPFTICHELSHLRGYMQEEEANFIAVLATIGADDAYYNYSGYVSAWVYAGNALARVDADAFASLYGALNARTRQDLLYNNQYWQQFEGKPAEVHEKVNDAYLKAQGQTAGTASYGHVTDLMLAYFAEHGTLE